jgi:outer membrane protein assembly factor BamB
MIRGSSPLGVVPSEFKGLALTSLQKQGNLRVHEVKAGPDMLIILLLVLIGTSLAVENVAITEPQDGATYDGDWLTVRAIVENDNELPDSVHYSLNGDPVVLIPRLNTDWYTYMQNDLRHGYSESPAPTDNTILWTAPVTGTGHEFVSPVVVDGRVYHSSEEQEIAFCLDAATGAEIWRFENIGDPIDDGMHVQDGKAYLASDSIWCLDAITGDRIWAFATGGVAGFNGPPTVYEDRVIVFDWMYFIVYALDLETGNEIWSTDTLTFCASTPTAWNGLVFVPSVSGHLRAFSTETGETAWVTDGFGTFWDSSPTIVAGEIYIGSWNGSLYRIDALDGTVIDTFNWPPWEIIESTPAVHDDLVYFGLDDYFLCVDRFTGVSQWEFAIGNDYLHASPGVADGLVFWGDHDDTPKDSIVLIHAVDIETGTEVWNYTIEGAWKGVLSSPAITDGVMYIGAGDGNLYAFGTGLKYTYLDDLFAQVGTNELIVTSFDEGSAVAADTINFTVTGTGIHIEPSLNDLCTSPNPFSSNLSITYNVPEPALVELSVYDISGRLVENLVSGSLLVGDNNSVWNPNPVLPNGCYLIVLDVCGKRAVRRCVLLR